MNKRKPEIAPAEYFEFIVRLLADNWGVLPMDEVINAIKRRYGRHFSAADKRPMTLRHGVLRPKWQNNVDWAKARGAKDGVLATVKHEKRKWLVLLDEADDFWVELANAQTRKHSFRKKCPNCGAWCRLGDANCTNCGYVFPPPPEKRRIT